MYASSRTMALGRPSFRKSLRTPIRTPQRIARLSFPFFDVSSLGAVNTRTGKISKFVCEVNYGLPIRDWYLID
jgi:hypothetical protein